jgi:hypothetical protein
MALFWGSMMIILEYLLNLFYINFNNLGNYLLWAGFCLDFEKAMKWRLDHWRIDMNDNRGLKHSDMFVLVVRESIYHVW